MGQYDDALSITVAVIIVVTVAFVQVNNCIVCSISAVEIFAVLQFLVVCKIYMWKIPMFVDQNYEYPFSQEIVFGTMLTQSWTLPVVSL